MEDWIYLRVAGNGDVIEYLKLEFVYWLKEVYFNKEKFYLDLEIEFFDKDDLEGLAMKLENYGK